MPEPTTDLVRQHLPPGVALSAETLGDDEIRRMYRIAEGLAKSGMFKDAQQATQAFAKMLIGRELGLSTAQAMTGLHIVQGGVMVHYATLARFVRAHGYSWKTLERSETRAAALFYDPEGNELDEVEFTMADAERAGLTKPSSRGEPSMYSKYPRNMLWARMMSNAVRFVIPEATAGIPLYVEGEIPEARAALTAGEGDGEAQGLDLGPQVEGVIARATELGHAALANRANIEMALGKRSPDVVRAWVDRAVADLNAFEAARQAEPPEAEIVPDEEDVPLEPQELAGVQVDVLRARLRDLEDRRAEVEESPSTYAETSEALEQVDTEIEQVQGQLLEVEEA